MADPLFSEVAALLHFDGTNGSTAFTDSSSHGHAFSIGDGTPTISTTQSKFGGASGRFAVDYITTPHDAVFLFGADPFTIEFFVRFDSLATAQSVAANGKFSGSEYNWIVQYFSSTSSMVFRHVILGTVYGPTSAMSANTWHHVAVSRFDIGGGFHRIVVFADGVGGTPSDIADSTDLDRGNFPLNIGGYPDSSIGLAGYVDEFRITNGTARYTLDFTPPSEPFEEAEAEPEAIVEVDGPLGAQLVFGKVVQPELLVLDAGFPSAPQSVADVTPAMVASVDGPLGSPCPLSHHDFTAFLDSTKQNFYSMDLVTPGGLVRVPISSWQATLQTDVQSYVQCVVPAATEFVPDIEAATEFVIRRRGQLLDGRTIEYEMARSPAQTVSLDGGAYNHTATISGYTAAITAVEDPPTALDRTLSGVRTTSRNSGNVRVRCNIDWLLRPGHRAYLGEEAIVVRYVNYYVPGFDQYMDIGDRAS